jgi:hypothetical protein
VSVDAFERLRLGGSVDATDHCVKFAEKGCAYQCGKFEIASARFIDVSTFD